MTSYKLCLQLKSQGESDKQAKLGFFNVEVITLDHLKWPKSGILGRFILKISTLRIRLPNFTIVAVTAFPSKNC